MDADYATRSEIIESHQRERVMVAGYPGLIGWTTHRTVSNGHTTSFTVQLGDFPVLALTHNVTVVDDISIPAFSPDPFVTAGSNVVQFRPRPVHVVGNQA